MDHELRVQLGKLLLMLSSPNDGEVANAARAIGKLLKRNGADWHDLVALVTLTQYLPAVERSDGWWRDDAAAIFASGIQLSFKEYTFVDSMTRQRYRPTEKQERWLDHIYRRAL